jgi:hypothetical protein
MMEREYKNWGRTFTSLSLITGPSLSDSVWLPIKPREVNLE